jgi:cbb3-type cytochrome oxidase subunit 3
MGLGTVMFVIFIGCLAWALVASKQDDDVHEQMLDE